MTITKTEVAQALAAAGVVCHGDVLSNTPVTVSQGVLALLVEAAKCAKYRKIEPTAVAVSGAYWMLDDGSPVITGR